MALVSVLNQWPDELEADFHQFFGLDIYELGVAGTETTPGVLKVSRLLRQLPDGSRVRAKLSPDEVFDTKEHLLRMIEFDLRSMFWALCGKKGSRPPKPIPLPSDAVKAAQEKAHMASSKAFVDAQLKKIQGRS